MPTYPLTMPTVPAPKKTAFRLKRMVGYSESFTSGQQQVYEHPFALWVGEVQLPPMRRDKAGPWQSFLMECHGRSGTFLLGDWDGRVPRGTARSAQVSGAGQTGTQITLKGMGSGSTLLPGDWIQLGSGGDSRLHMITGGGNGANSGGVAVFQIEPRIKISPPDSATVTLVNARGVFRLAVNEVGWDSDEVSVYGITFAVQEAF